MDRVVLLQLLFECLLLHIFSPLHIFILSYHWLQINIQKIFSQEMHQNIQYNMIINFTNSRKKIVMQSKSLQQPNLILPYFLMLLNSIFGFFQVSPIIQLVYQGLLLNGLCLATDIHIIQAHSFHITIRIFHITCLLRQIVQSLLHHD